MTRVLEACEVGEAVGILRSGGLVAFPTETVYGLGADASNDVAIAKVYEAKGRPTGHPLIVHLAVADQVSEWSTTTDSRARILAEAFWPGPLTLILPRSKRVSLAATGGRETVGLRVPEHELTLRLLAEFGSGLVGPSANRFGHVSPTTAAHVVDDLEGRIDAVLDGGPCQVGIESTIVEIADDGPVVLLRPGGVTVHQLELAIGEPVLDGRGGESRAAGMMASHYAPSAAVRLVDSIGDLELGPRVAVIMTDAGVRESETEGERGSEVTGVLSVAHLPSDASGFARGLYAALRAADEQDPEEIVVVRPTSGRLLKAVLDRLEKASS